MCMFSIVATAEAHVIRQTIVERMNKCNYVVWTLTQHYSQSAVCHTVFAWFSFSRSPSFTLSPSRTLSSPFVSRAANNNNNGACFVLCFFYSLRLQHLVSHSIGFLFSHLCVDYKKYMIRCFFYSLNRFDLILICLYRGKLPSLSQSKCVCAQQHFSRQITFLRLFLIGKMYVKIGAFAANESSNKSNSNNKSHSKWWDW